MTLHQRNDCEQVSLMQVIGLLSQSVKDFQGGEVVMTDQHPRMQSPPVLLSLKLGDAAIIATTVGPFKATKGYYWVNLKHAISRVRQGERIGLEFSFHDTQSHQGAPPLCLS